MAKKYGLGWRAETEEHERREGGRSVGYEGKGHCLGKVSPSIPLIGWFVFFLIPGWLTWVWAYLPTYLLCYKTLWLPTYIPTCLTCPYLFIPSLPKSCLSITSQNSFTVACWAAPFLASHPMLPPILTHPRTHLPRCLIFKKNTCICISRKKKELRKSYNY